MCAFIVVLVSPVAAQNRDFFPGIEPLREPDLATSRSLGDFSDKKVRTGLVPTNNNYLERYNFRGEVPGMGGMIIPPYDFQGAADFLGFEVGDQCRWNSNVAWTMTNYLTMLRTIYNYGSCCEDSDSPYFQAPFSPYFSYNNGGNWTFVAAIDLFRSIGCCTIGDDEPFLYNAQESGLPGECFDAEPYDSYCVETEEGHLFEAGMNKIMGGVPFWCNKVRVVEDDEGNTYLRSRYNNRVNNLKAWLSGAWNFGPIAECGEPLAIGIPVFESFVEYGGYSQLPEADSVVEDPFPSSFIYDVEDPKNDPICGYQSLLVIGYGRVSDLYFGDDEPPLEEDETFFLAVNTWGEEWGYGGLVYLSEDFVRRYCLEAWRMYYDSGDITDHYEVFIEGQQIEPGFTSMTLGRNSEDEILVEWGEYGLFIDMEGVFGGGIRTVSSDQPEMPQHPVRAIVIRKRRGAYFGSKIPVVASYRPVNVLFTDGDILLTAMPECKKFIGKTNLFLAEDFTRILMREFNRNAMWQYSSLKSASGAPYFEQYMPHTLQFELGLYDITRTNVLAGYFGIIDSPEIEKRPITPGIVKLLGVGANNMVGIDKKMNVVLQSKQNRTIYQNRRNSPYICESTVEPINVFRAMILIYSLLERLDDAPAAALVPLELARADADFYLDEPGIIATDINRLMMFGVPFSNYRSSFGVKSATENGDSIGYGVHSMLDVRRLLSRETVLRNQSDPVAFRALMEADVIDAAYGDLGTMLIRGGSAFVEEISTGNSIGRIIVKGSPFDREPEGDGAVDALLLPDPPYFGETGSLFAADIYSGYVYQDWPADTRTLGNIGRIHADRYINVEDIFCGFFDDGFSDAGFYGPVHQGVLNLISVQRNGRIEEGTAWVSTERESRTRGGDVLLNFT
ncbi:hypothetical protein GF348_05305, partial [candidate division KSB3 bacterium]|nr:hypothetical protein [candidate division KSB3 bacterium]